MVYHLNCEPPIFVMGFALRMEVASFFVYKYLKRVNASSQMMRQKRYNVQPDPRGNAQIIKSD